MIPDLAEPVVRQILKARARRYRNKPLVLDVGCSYGINAAVHRFPVDFATLRRRYSRHEMGALSAQELARLDTHYFSSWPDGGLAQFAGLDISAPAIRYATGVGLLEHGIAADLERDRLRPNDADVVRDVDVILSTGCIGYVTQKTYATLLQTTSRAPWIISFVLRMFPYDSIEKAAAERGLVTERLAGAVFTQRRFRDIVEFEQTLKALADRGVDTTGFESEGLLQAELYLSRPAEDVAAASLDEIVTVSSGRNRPMGARYVRIVSSKGQRTALEQ